MLLKEKTDTNSQREHDPVQYINIFTTKKIQRNFHRNAHMYNMARKLLRKR